MGLFKRKKKDSGAGSADASIERMENNGIEPAGVAYNVTESAGAARVENNVNSPLGYELAAVLSAAVSASEAGFAGNSPSGDELAVVLSAAVSAYEADNFAASPAQGELAAVIAAAVAAYEGGGTGFPYIGAGPSGLHIRKINRAAGYVPAWGVMGNRDAIDTRRF